MNGQLQRRDFAEKVDEPRAENPFATRFTRPGALPFLFDGDESAAAIVARFVAAGGRGAIVGPHGSGKSTLLETLRPALCEAGMNPIVHTLHDGQRRLSREHPLPSQSNDVLVIDGYEQLNWWGRREVRRAVQHASAGLLVTSHAAVAGLPTIFTTRPTWELSRRVVRELTPSLPALNLSEDELRRRYEQCNGNLRELLFKLYDLYESQRS
jgi:hypothetical protein